MKFKRLKKHFQQRVAYVGSNMKNHPLIIKRKNFFALNIYLVQKSFSGIVQNSNAFVRIWTLFSIGKIIIWGF